MRTIPILASLGLITAGCGSTPAADPSPKPAPVAAITPTPFPAATQPAATQPATTRPGVLVEAKMPEGFPDPGPVGEVIVKQYPACRVVQVAAKTGGPNRMFMSLFNHIESNKIPMTSPVIITWTGTDPPTESAMAFVYGSPKTGKPGPDGNVDVVDVPAVTVLSVGVRGDYDAEHFQAGMKKLQDYLASHAGQYFMHGPPRYLSYNSPFVPGFAKYGEVQIPVDQP